MNQCYNVEDIILCSVHCKPLFSGAKPTYVYRVVQKSKRIRVFVIAFDINLSNIDRL